MARKKKKISIQEVFSKKLKLLRTEKGLSQTEFGKMVGIHYTHISNYERGLALPGVDAVVRIAMALKVSVDYLLFDANTNVAATNIQDPELLEAFAIVSRMDVEDKDFIKRMMQAAITQHQVSNPILGKSKKKAV